MNTTTRSFMSDLIAGLDQRPRSISPKYLYDEEGSQLFEKICALEEYYPTRTELFILKEHAEELAQELGPHCALIEPGAGASIKTRILLSQMQEPAGYAPIDVSGEFLEKSSEALHRDFPKLPILPIWADFTLPLNPPRLIGASNRAVFFPGSTLGNFDPPEAASLLRQFRSWIKPNGALIVGIDLIKDVSTLERAYNDTAGITAAFNLNLLKRANRELGANFDLGGFEHRSIYNKRLSRIEMHLVSRFEQTVRLGEHEFYFEKGETIQTESSYKYSIPSFADLASHAGLTIIRTWTDPQNYFGVFLLSPAIDQQHALAHPA